MYFQQEIQDNNKLYFCSSRNKLLFKHLKAEEDNK